MREYLKISLCTVVMNRLFHIEKTLLKNIRDNECYPFLEFVLLDYNSQDGLQEWAEIHLSKYIESKTLVYYRTNEPKYFSQSHSRNMIFRLATGDIICNIDADNYTGEGFTFYINNKLNTEYLTNILIKNHYLDDEDDRNTLGRICMPKEAFMKVNGYDEKMNGYGFEDRDLINRLNREGYTSILIDNKKYLKSIPHTNELRIKEEAFSNDVIKILINRINHYTSKLVFLKIDFSFESAKLIDNVVIRSLKGTPNEEDKDYTLSIHDNIWRTGTWDITSTETITLNYPEEKETLLPILPKKNIFISNKQEQFHLLDNSWLIENLFYVYPQLKNRIQKDRNDYPSNKINLDGFGRGVVHRNFAAGIITLS